MTYAYSFTDHFIISLLPFVFLPHSHPATEPIANTEYKNDLVVQFEDFIKHNIEGAEVTIKLIDVL